MKDFTICIGTSSAGIFQSRDSGYHWRQTRLGMPCAPWAPWIQVRSISASPHDPNQLLTGTAVGVHLSEDGGANWEYIASPADQLHVWSTAWHPADRDILYIGIAPADSNRAAIFRSYNRGRTWEPSPVPMAARSSNGANHVSSIVFDPSNPHSVWAGTADSGLFHSGDGGDTWTKQPLRDGPRAGEQIHNVAMANAQTILVTTPEGVWSSRDGGNSFALRRFPPSADSAREPGSAGPDAYTGGMAVKSGRDGTVFVGTGDGVPGKTGALHMSTDAGQTWSQCDVPAPPNSHIHSIAVHSSDPNIVTAASLFGYTYVSRNGGRAWEKMPRSFGEIRAVAWVPQ